MRRLTNARRGFTLIELLVVVLILAILMAVALPLYLNAVADSQKKTCRANMQTIANAAQAYKVSSPNKDFGTLPMSGAAIATTYKDLQATPICPAGGTYTVNSTTAGGIQLECSYNKGKSDEHGTFTPGVDGS